MSKNVAVIAALGHVVAINVHDDDYEPQPWEVVVDSAAWIGGDYVGGYLYAPQPFPSWTRHEGEWLPPVPMPTDGDLYIWNEAAGEWVSVDE